MSRADHMDVAAYALGVLDPQDAERFEEHLATCWACAAELETMVPVVGMLSGIDGETMMALEQTQTDPALLDRTLHAVRLDRRRTRVRQLLATAAAVVAFGAVTGVGFATVFHDDRQFQQAEPAPTVPTAAPTPGPTASDDEGVGGPFPVDGEKHAATDPGTGVKSTMWLASKDYGTQIYVQLAKLPGPRTCRLVVVRTNKTSEVVSSWSVPGTGYGTSARSTPLELSASTSASRSDIDKIQVQSIDASGVATPLVTIDDL